MKALILSGGTGTRLRPLTFTHAKQLMPLANRPILFYILDKIQKCGIQEVGVIVGDTHKEIKEILGYGEKWNLHISYIHQAAPLGLGHAVKLAEDFMGDSEFIMFLGDNAFNVGINNFINNYKKSHANTSLMLYRVKDPSPYGVAVVDGKLITKLVEKPKESLSDLIISGIYIFDQSIFKAIEKTEPSRRGELEITDAIQKQIDSGGTVTYEIMTGWWKDTGSVHDILEANMNILSEMETSIHSFPDESSSLSGNLIIGKDVIIKNSVISGPAAIADGSIIIDSFIGPYTSVGEKGYIANSEIENCIIMENTRISNIEKRISGSLIGRNAEITNTNSRPYSNCFVVGDNSRIYL